MRGGERPVGPGGGEFWPPFPFLFAPATEPKFLFVL